MNKFLFFFLSNCVENRKSGCEKCDEESSHKYIIYYLNVTRTQRGSLDTISIQLDRRDLVALHSKLRTSSNVYCVATLSTTYYAIKKRSTHPRI